MAIKFNGDLFTCLFLVLKAPSNETTNIDLSVALSNLFEHAKLFSSLSNTKDKNSSHLEDYESHDYNDEDELVIQRNSDEQGNQTSTGVNFVFFPLSFVCLFV